MILGLSAIDLIEIGQIDLLLYFPNLLLAVMLAPVQHAVHEQVHVLVQVRRIEIDLLFWTRLGKLLWLLRLMTNRLDHEAIGGGRRGRPEDRTRRSFQDFGMAEKESICFELLILSTPIRGPSFIVRQVGAGTMYLIRFSQLQALSPVHLAQRQLAPPEGGRRGVAVSVLMEAEHAP